MQYVTDSWHSPISSTAIMVLITFLTPIWNCTQLTAITKNWPNGILKISISHMSMQMGMTNQYVLDIFTPHLLTIF